MASWILLSYFLPCTLLLLLWPVSSSFSFSLYLCLLHLFVFHFIDRFIVFCFPHTVDFLPPGTGYIAGGLVVLSVVAMSFRLWSTIWPPLDYRLTIVGCLTTVGRCPSLGHYLAALRPLLCHCRPLSGQSPPLFGHYLAVFLPLLGHCWPLLGCCLANRRLSAVVCPPLGYCWPFSSQLLPVFGCKGGRRLRKGNLIWDRSHREIGRNPKESITQRNGKERIERISGRELQRIST